MTGCLFVYSSFILGALGPTEAPFHNPKTLDDTTGVRLRPEASKSFFLASSCASSSFYFSGPVTAFLIHLLQLTSSHAPDYTSFFILSQPCQPPVLGNPSDDVDPSSPSPSPLPL